MSGVLLIFLPASLIIEAIRGLFGTLAKAFEFIEQWADNVYDELRRILIDWNVITRESLWEKIKKSEDIDSRIKLLESIRTDSR